MEFAMGFWETVGATALGIALGASVPGLALWTLKTYAARRWKRTDPVGQGYARFEGLIEEVMKGIPDYRALMKKDEPPEPK